MYVYEPIWYGNFGNPNFNFWGIYSTEEKARKIIKETFGKDPIDRVVNESELRSFFEINVWVIVQYKVQ